MAADPLIQALRLCFDECVPEQSQLCVAYSGGLDSSVLLHGLATWLPPHQLRAVHVDHGLHADSASWAEFCRQSCERLGVSFALETVEVDPSLPGGPEARARGARYGALRAGLRPGEWLVTAHHQQDQAETFLLQLMRGAGPAGLAAMSICQEREGSLHFRPLLTVSPDVIRAYALKAGLEWLEDPSNRELSFDRNFVRHEVLPLLKTRWPAADQVVARSARLCARSAASIAELAHSDLKEMLRGNQLDLTRFRCLPAQRRAESLRAALRELGLPVPSERQLELAITQLLHASNDALPCPQWPGVGIRRYRNTAWIYAEHENALFDQVAPEEMTWHFRQPLELGPVGGVLEGIKADGTGIAERHLHQVLQIRFRSGGERLRVAAGGQRRTLKNLLQENDVVPWMRAYIPLIYSGDHLLAVGDLWVDVDYAAAAGEPGLSLQWHSHSAFK